MKLNMKTTNFFTNHITPSQSTVCTRKSVVGCSRGRHGEHSTVGRYDKLKRHGGYTTQDGCGAHQRGAAPRTAQGMPECNNENYNNNLMQSSQRTKKRYIRGPKFTLRALTPPSQKQNYLSYH